MPGLDPGIHDFAAREIKTWMAGTSPAMTKRKSLVKAVTIAAVLTIAASQAHAQPLPGGFVY